MEWRKQSGAIGKPNHSKVLAEVGRKRAVMMSDHDNIGKPKIRRMR